MKEWKDCPREDLNMIPKMEAAGWIPEFSTNDVRYGRITPDYVPRDAVSFINGQIHAWKAIREKWKPEGNEICWRVADLIDQHFRNHRWYETLKEVIENEKS